MAEENSSFFHVDTALKKEQREIVNISLSRNSNRSLLTVDFSSLSLVIVLLPLVSFTSCVVLSLLFNFNEVTRTHCNVANYIPSLSAATGDFTPQKYIWRIGIALHALPRMANAFIYLNFYADSVNIHRKSNGFRMLNKMNTALHVLENSALLGLTYISSTENHDVHEYCFIAFMATSMAYMFTNCILFKWTAQKPMTKQESKSFKWKVGLLLTNYLSFATAVYFFFRHNWYCEPGDLRRAVTVYSLFALCEYITIISNIGFHATLILDCKGRVWTLTFDKEQLHKNY